MIRNDVAKHSVIWNGWIRNTMMVLSLSTATGCLAQVAPSATRPAAANSDTLCPVSNAMTLDAYKTLTRMSYQWYQRGDNQAAADLADALWVTVEQSRGCLVRGGVSEGEADRLDDMFHSFCRPLRWYKYHDRETAKHDEVALAYQKLTQELTTMK